MDWELGASKYKVLYIEWISDKVLLNSKGNIVNNL